MTAANALYYGDCLAVMEEMAAYGPISASFRPRSLAGHRSKWRQIAPQF